MVRGKGRKMKTLYVSDLDGTLLSRNSRLTDEAAERLNRMIRQGLSFTYATARSILSAGPIVSNLELRLPVITYNGTFVIDPVTKKTIFSSAFTNAELALLIELMRKFRLSPIVYSYIDGIEKVSWQRGTENEGMAFYLNSRKGDPRMRGVASPDALFEGNVFHFTCIGEQEELSPFYERVIDEGCCQAVFQQELYRKEYWCELMPKEATKASALLKLKEKLGYEKVVVFGDAKNDIPMFLAADEAYAVENAVPELKENASGIIGSNEEDGVVNWLLTYGQLQTE